jgi:hypothetical protein
MSNRKAFRLPLAVSAGLEAGFIALASTGSLGPCLNDSGARFLLGALGAAACTVCVLMLSTFCLAKGDQRIGALGLFSQVLVVAVPLAMRAIN